jgi:hypothetical protein
LAATKKLSDVVSVPEIVLVGIRAVVTPAGIPDAERTTPSSNPPVVVKLRPSLALKPASTLTVVSEGTIVNDCIDVTDTLAVLLIEPAVT